MKTNMSNKFNRSISTAQLLLTSINCMVGGGWLMVAYYGATASGPASILSWSISAILIVVIAFCFSELSTTFPIAGGIARYSHFSHGASISFGMSWLAWLSCVACAPTEVQVIVQHVVPYYPDHLPSLIYSENNISHFTTLGFIAAIILLAIMSWINTVGVKFLMRFSSTIAVWKLFFPVVTILMILTTRFEPSNFVSHEFMPMGWQGVLEGTTTCIFAFLGFREATCLASEVEKPHIAIPVAVIGSVAICFLIYLSLQVAFIGSVKPEMLTNGWRYLSYASDSAPLVGIVKSLGLLWLSATISADSIISPFGTGLSYTATSARLVVAISKNGFAPRTFMNLSTAGVPISAIFLNFVVGTLMFFTLTAWKELVDFQTLAMFIAYAVGPISLCSLRDQLPNIERPFVIPGGKFGCLLVFYACNLLSLWIGWSTFKITMLWLLAGYVTFVMHTAYSARSSAKALFTRSTFWIFPYFFGLTLLSYLSKYGNGIGLIPIGIDFFVYFLFSLIILTMAYQSRLPREECEKMVANMDQYDFSESV